MIFRRPIRSAGVLSLLVAAAVGFTAEPADARPRKRAPTRTAKQVKPPPPIAVPLPRPSPLRETTVAVVAVPLPRANPLTAAPEPTAPSLRLFAPNAQPAAPGAQPVASSAQPAAAPGPEPAGPVSAAALKGPRLPPIPAEFAARELAFTAVIGDSAVGDLPPELLSPSPLYKPAASQAPVPTGFAPTPRQIASAIATAVMPPALAMPAPPATVQIAPAAVPSPPPLAAAPPAAAVPPPATVPMPPLPPLAKRPLETAAAPAAPLPAAPLPEPSPPPPLAPPAEAAAPAEVAAVAPTDPVPPEDGFDAADAAEDTTGVHEFASLEDVPGVVRQLAESLPDCVPLDQGARRQPFGDRTLFSFACPAERREARQRAFVLARDALGNGANVLMFPRPGGKAVEPMHELEDPRVNPQAREFIHNAVDRSERPCRQQGRWRIDDRGNAGLLGWRSSNSCDGAWASAALSEKKDKPAAKASRGSKKASAKKSSRGKGKATARKAPAKKKPVSKKKR